MTREHNTDAGAASVRLLARVGAALYGRQWQCELARALDVSDRSVRYWLAGAHPIPRGVWADLLRAIADRRTALSGLGDAVRAASSDVRS